MDGDSARHSPPQIKGTKTLPGGPGAVSARGRRPGACSPPPPKRLLDETISPTGNGHLARRAHLLRSGMSWMDSDSPLPSPKGDSRRPRPAVPRHPPCTRGPAPARLPSSVLCAPRGCVPKAGWPWWGGRGLLGDSPEAGHQSASCCEGPMGPVPEGGQTGRPATVPWLQTRVLLSPWHLGGTCRGRETSPRQPWREAPLLLCGCRPAPSTVKPLPSCQACALESFVQPGGSCPALQGSTD